MRTASKLMLTTLVAAGLVLGGCASSDADRGEPATAGDLAGNWELVSGEGPDGALEAVGEPITGSFNFEEDAGFSGSVGCNQLFGPAAVEEGGKLKLGPIASTMMMCEEPVMKLEQNYLAALENVDFAGMRDGTLILSGKKTHMEFISAAVSAGDDAAVQEGTGAAPVAGTWTLDSGKSADGPLLPVDGAAILLEVAADGTASATAGCNQMGAQVSAQEDGAISIAGTFSTLKACEDALMELEQQYMTALESVTSYEEANGQLHLSGTDTELAFTAE